MSIYKYLPPKRIDVLSGGKIRFTQPNALNDPFEFKPFFKTIFNTGTFRDRIRKGMDFRPVLLEKYEQMPTEVRRKFAANQFVELSLSHMEQNKDQYDEMFQRNMDEMTAAMPKLSEKLRSLLHSQLGSGIGILSLSEDPTNDLMWAHYGSDHSGFVVEFDETNEFFHSQRSDKDEFFRLRKVNYIGKRLNFESFEQLIDDQNDLFTSKLDSWAHEKEWRMLMPLLDRVPEINAAEPIHLLPFPKSAVKAVIFGNKSSRRLREEACELLDVEEAYSHVERHVAYVDLENGRIAMRPLI